MNNLEKILYIEKLLAFAMKKRDGFEARPSYDVRDNMNEIWRQYVYRLTKKKDDLIIECIEEETK